VKAQRTAQLAAGESPSLRKFVHISTDEVYGDLDIDIPEGCPLPDDVNRRLGRGAESRLYGSGSVCESSPLRPSSPYSAAKASADLMVLAYKHSFGLPVCITRCSNNYGPYQHPEKLIPLMVNNIRLDRPLPVYGSGLNVRDWLHVEDHVEAIDLILHNGRPGEMYCIGGSNERSNIDLVRLLVRTTDRLLGRSEGTSERLITFVGDRAGHDMRYAIDSSKLRRELGWQPLRTFEEGIEQTVAWYL